MVVYNYKGGPCYRCLFPTPPPSETVTNCADGGVLGPVTGVIGSLQAMEAIKIALGMHPDPFQPTLTMYSADRNPCFSSVRLRPRKPTCAVCGDQPTVHVLEDYVAFCGQAPTDATQSLTLLSPSQRISCIEYREWINLHSKVLPHLLLDVRDPVQYAICSLPNSINIPVAQLKSRLPELEEELFRVSKTRVLPPSPVVSSREKQSPTLVRPVLFVVCRLGNDSQLAVSLLNQHFHGPDASPDLPVIPEAILDLIGGLYTWTRQVDDQFPVY
ncbi:Molybdenum cofactor synthesis protein 3 [Entomophthora muscae]|nr:Molybdenum cofactor synthesis protein 3 [Entomophthora muscae]